MPTPTPPRPPSTTAAPSLLDPAPDWLTRAGHPLPGAVHLEPEFHAPYRAYRKNPGPATAGALLRAVQPVLDRGVAAYGGGAQAGPLARSHARRIALGALDRYDPAKGPLGAHLLQHLQGLQRLTARPHQALSVPERVALDRRKLAHGEAELEDRLGRPPSTAELADHLGLSLKRIAHVRRYRPGFTEAQVRRLGGGGDGDDDGGPYEPAVAPADPIVPRLEFLYPDLDPIDQAIVEHTFGLHGRSRLRPSRLAVRLNLSPSTISKRSSRIVRQLDDLARTEILP